MDRLADSLDKARLAEYVDLQTNTRRLLYLSFVAGVAQGFGMAGLYLGGSAGALSLAPDGEYSCSGSLYCPDSRHSYSTTREALIRMQNTQEIKTRLQAEKSDLSS